VEAETRKETVDEYQKSQTIRLIDVFIIGPVLIYAGIKHRKDMSPLLSGTLILFGAATVYYNAKNYMVNGKRDNLVLCTPSVQSEIMEKVVRPVISSIVATDFASEKAKKDQAEKDQAEKPL
jgi:hypothetical protein